MIGLVIRGTILKWFLNIDLTFQDKKNWRRKWFVSFNDGITETPSFEYSNNTGVIDIKTHGFLLDEKSSFKILRLSYKLVWVDLLILHLLIKLPLRKFQPWLVPWYSFIFINLPFGLVRNNSLVTRLLLLTGTWVCWVKIGNCGLLLPRVVLH